MPNPQTVRNLFAVIAGRYDLLNHVLSFSIDRIWRRRLVGLADAGNRSLSVIDICTGTGDISLCFRKRTDARIVGVDFSPQMLDIAQRKAVRSGYDRGVSFVCGDALRLPFADGSFDVATMGFGLRNLSDTGVGINEAARVVRTGGRVMILEFAPPKGAGPLFLYRLYLRFMIPIIGGLLTGRRYAYRHLSDTIAGFLKPEGVIGVMEEHGLTNLKAVRLTGGIAYIYIGQKDRSVFS